jgi:hypothetical protein
MDMSLTRWKLLAGIFGLSLCGIAALAEPACRSLTTRRNDESQQKERPELPKAGSLPRPLEVALPNPTELKPLTPIVPVPATIPTAEPAATPLPSPLPTVPQPSQPVPVPELLNPSPPVKVPLTPLVPVTLPSPEPKKQDLVVVTPKAPLPEVTGTLISPELFAEMFAQQFGKPNPVPTPVLKPELTTMKPVPVVVPVPTPAPAPAPAQTPLQGLNPPFSPPIATLDRKFTVTLKMGEGHPRFEVLDGEDMLLKVISEGVEVKSSPSEKGETFSTLKAVRRVKFITPGGEGACDELQVVPGTGDVVATGNVKFTTRWGKVETAVTSERMTFRLGTPGPMSLSDDRRKDERRPLPNENLLPASRD